MKLVWVTWLAALIMLAFSAVAQNDNQPELPSAPSAVQEQKEPPKSAPSQAQKSAPTRPQSSRPSDIQELKPIGQEAPPTAPAVPDTTASKPDPQEPTAAPASPSSEAKPSPSGDADSAENDKSLTTIRKTVNEVNVVFVVTDKHGHYVKDLKKDNFRVLDDNKPAKEIRSFRNETDLPLQVGLLVDASNSVRDRFKFEQEAAIEFLNQIIRPGYDKAFVIGFDTTPELTQDFTDSTELLSRGVRALRAGGGTAMYDALYFACRDKLKNAPRKSPVRRAIILLSDGEDNQSRVTREESIEMAQRAEVIVYTISTNVSGVKRQGDKILERIADATGGRAFFPFQLRDVSNDFAEIQNELRSQYALAYIPEDFRMDGRFRSIQITADQKSFHVRSRRGYYAPAQ
ncbi:MAG TPA: VWA domain-containing protein [Terriglobales bacterium]|nr:VWA domain-containing protein [Terriglobales bacterium]